MQRTLLTGATGTLGQALQPRLRGMGHTVRAASRSPPDDGGDGPDVDADDPNHDENKMEWVALDLESGRGIERAVEDVDVIVHAASDAVGDSEAVDVRGTEQLLEAAESAGVEHIVYISIVGIDEIPYSYYEHKLAAEAAIEASDVPETILRATQFHQFVDQLLGMVAWSPVWLLPTDFRVQPVDVREVADRLADLAAKTPQGRVPPMSGPEVKTGRELVDAYREARDLRRLVFRLPVPGAAATEFRAGTNTCPDHAIGDVTWESWVSEEYSQATDSPPTPSTGSPSS